MRKMVVFKHVANEVLGTLKPTLREEGFRIRYVNFGREPGTNPSLDGYQGLVVLGGWMGVYEADRYPHIKVECQLIERALHRGMPVLGICLGSQLLAHALGAPVRRHSEKEVGWCEVEFTDAGRADPLFASFTPRERLFQMHGDTFEIPAGCAHLARSAACAGQAFRYGAKAYGLQFHLEVDQGMIDRFLRVPENRVEVETFGGREAVQRLADETTAHLPRSLSLSRDTFRAFINLFELGERSKRVSGNFPS